MYYETLKQMMKTLAQLDTWLAAAGAHAQAKSFDPTVFLGARLAPDQFAFARQVQLACDTAKGAAAKLTGKEAPDFPDTEQSLGELSVRVKAVLAYLETFQPSDFDGAADRRVTQPRWEGSYMMGKDYFLSHALPNFFFHVTHAYAILRHNGVNLGKRDFLGTLVKHSP